MIAPKVTSRRQAFLVTSNEPVSAEYAAGHPTLVIWRNVTTDLETDEEVVIRPINAPEDEVDQDEVK